MMRHRGPRVQGIMIGLCLLVSSSCAGDADDSDVSAECTSTCAETHALTFDLERECLPANQIPADLG